jgi:hypothetical protein
MILTNGLALALIIGVALWRERRAAPRAWTLSEWHAAMEKVNLVIEQQRVQLARAEALREELYQVPVELGDDEVVQEIETHAPGSSG